MSIAAPSSSSISPSTSPSPSIRQLVFVPALITLAVSGVRLWLEFRGAPGWLASSNMGGGAALLGIVWLPAIFGPIFALRLRRHVAAGKPLRRRLWRTLTIYGLLARAPIALITIPAVLGEWGTHYDKFPGITGVATRIGAGFVAQLGFWACLWTPLLGIAAASIVLKLRPARGA